MNTAYPELLRDDEARRAAFAVWNAGIQTSMDEYATHLFAHCPHQGNCTRAARRKKANA